MSFFARPDLSHRRKPCPLDVALQQLSRCVAMRDAGLPAEQWAYPLRLAARAVSLEATIIGASLGQDAAT